MFPVPTKTQSECNGYDWCISVFHNCKEQNGFRRGRKVKNNNNKITAQILTLRRLIEGVKAKQLTAVLTFVDFRKAFDSIHRGILMEILIAYGIPRKVVKAIEVLYKSTSAKVFSPDGDTESFEILAGVLQGDTLTPFLFIIALDYAMRMASRNESEVGFRLQQSRSRRHPATYITDTNFADDLALISETIEQAQLFLLRVETCAAQVGLHANADKTKYMTYNLEESYLKSLSGDDIEHVDDFPYLGSWVDTSEKDLNTRIAKAWSTMSKMEVIWKSNLEKKLKINFFRATVETSAIVWMHDLDSNQSIREEIRWDLHTATKNSIKTSSGRPIQQTQSSMVTYHESQQL